MANIISRVRDTGGSYHFIPPTGVLMECYTSSGTSSKELSAVSNCPSEIVVGCKLCVRFNNGNTLKNITMTFPNGDVFGCYNAPSVNKYTTVMFLIINAGTAVALTDNNREFMQVSDSITFGSIDAGSSANDVFEFSYDSGKYYPLFLSGWRSDTRYCNIFNWYITSTGADTYSSDATATALVYVNNFKTSGGVAPTITVYMAFMKRESAFTGGSPS